MYVCMYVFMCVRLRVKYYTIYPPCTYTFTIHMLAVSQIFEKFFKEPNLFA